MQIGVNSPDFDIAIQIVYRIIGLLRTSNPSFLSPQLQMAAYYQIIDIQKLTAFAFFNPPFYFLTQIILLDMTEEHKEKIYRSNEKSQTQGNHRSHQSQLHQSQDIQGFHKSIPSLALQQVNLRISQYKHNGSLEIQQLILNRVLKGAICSNIKYCIENQPSIKILTLRQCDLVSVENLPNLGNLIGLDLGSNKLNDEAEFSVIANKYPKLKQLLLDENLITKLDSVDKLTSNKNLIELSFEGNTVSKIKNYREWIFKHFSSLIYLDDQAVTIKLLNKIKIQQRNASVSKKRKRKNSSDSDSSFSSLQANQKKSPQKKGKKTGSDTKLLEQNLKTMNQLKKNELIEIAISNGVLKPHKKPKNRLKTTYRKSQKDQIKRDIMKTERKSLDCEEYKPVELQPNQKIKKQSNKNGIKQKQDIQRQKSLISARLRSSSKKSIKPLTVQSEDDQHSSQITILRVKKGNQTKPNNKGIRQSQRLRKQRY